MPATEHAVVGLAAGATTDGISVLELRANNAESLAGSMEVVLHWFDARGEESRPALRWKTARGFSAQIANCGDHLYLAWRTAKGVVNAVVDKAGVRTKESLVGRSRPEPVILGPIACAADGARLLTGLSKTGSLLEPDPAVGLATLSAAPRAKAVWKTIKLPGPPESTLVGDPSIAAYPSKGSVQIVISHKSAARSVNLDLTTTTATLQPLDLGPGICVPSSDGQRAICGSTKRAPEKPECRDQESNLVVSFVGTAIDTTPVSAAEAYWQSGRIENVDALPLKQQAARLACGQGEWSALRSALETWCAPRAADPQSAAYCNARDPASLLYQAVNCSDQPLTCGVTQRTHVPSVSRAEYAAGKVELAYAKCSVWFGRTAGAWSVVDSECTGED